MKKTKLLSLLMAIIFVLTSMVACQQEPPIIPDDVDPGNEDIFPDTPNDDEPEVPEPTPDEPPTPQTGDESNMMVWFILLALSGVGIALSAKLIFKAGR